MRKLVLFLAAAGAALAAGSPAAAQYHPQQYGYGYNGYAYNQGSVRALRMRVNRIQQNLRRLAESRIISRNEYYNRSEDAREIERKLHHDARDGRGFNGREMAQTERRIARLEQKIARDMRDGRHYRRRW